MNSTINAVTAIRPQPVPIVGRFGLFMPENPTTNDNGSSSAASIVSTFETSVADLASAVRYASTAGDWPRCTVIKACWATNQSSS